MRLSLRVLVSVSALLLPAALGSGRQAEAQEISLKGGVAISHFQTTGQTPYNGRYVSTSFGGHARWRFGRIAIQPELAMTSRGAATDAASLDQRIRLDYIEIPLMIVVPVTVGSFEPYAFGGPMLSLETRCRTIVEEDGLKTNFGCDDESVDNVFERGIVDYGVSVGAGVSRRLGSGRVLLEGRHTWGLRDIYDGEDDGIELRNRSIVISIGYSISTEAMTNDR